SQAIAGMQRHDPSVSYRLCVRCRLPSQAELRHNLRMTAYTAKDFAESFRTVRKNTLTIAQEIPDKDYGFRAAPEIRTVAQALVHVSNISVFQLQIHQVERRTTLAGFDFPAHMQRMIADEHLERSKDEILAVLRERGDAYAKWVEGLDDAFL